MFCSLAVPLILFYSCSYYEGNTFVLVALAQAAWMEAVAEESGMLLIWTTTKAVYASFQQNASMMQLY